VKKLRLNEAVIYKCGSHRGDYTLGLSMDIHKRPEITCPSAMNVLILRAVFADLPQAN